MDSVPVSIAAPKPAFRRFPGFSRVRNRFAVLGLVLVALIGIGDWIAISMAREAAITLCERVGVNLGKGMSSQTGRMLGIIENGLRSVAEGIGIGDVANPELIKAQLRNSSTMSLLDDRVGKIPGIVGIALVDSAGRVASSAGGVFALDGYVAASDYFRALGGTSDPGPFITAPERDEGRGLWTANIARRLTDAQNHFAGIVVAAISLSEWEDFYRVAMPPNRALTVMRDDGLILLQYPRPAEPSGPMAEGLQARKVPATGCTTFHGRDLTGVGTVAAGLCKVKNMPLVIEASVSETEVVESSNGEKLWFILGGVLASVVVVGLLRLFANQVDRLQRSEALIAAEKREAEIAHRQLDVALSNIAQGVCFFDADNRLVVCNLRYLEIYQLPAALARPGAPLSDIVAHFRREIGIQNGEAGDHVEAIETIARAKESQPLVLELGDGRTIAIQVRSMAAGGWIATHEDITERRKAEQQIAFLAKHDALTGLANRSLLLDLIETARGEAKRGAKFAILFLDLDRFKAVNDTLGHGVGDALLRQVAGRLVELAGAGGVVARLGGDEFVILKNEFANPDELVKLARHIVERIAEPYRIEVHEIVIGVSVGVDVAGSKPATAEVLLKNADLALYMAKAHGRGTYRFFEPEMDSQLRGRDHLEAELRRALGERQFELEYQPVVQASSGVVTGFEALLRWNHPEKGRMMPGDFIAVAEDCGLIVPIGEWVIEQACWQAAQWPEEIRVAINLSAVQFRAVGIVPTIRDAIANNGVAAGRIDFEITETVLLRNNERNMAILQQLREIGVGIVMDDFGVGYSSLSYMRDFPITKVKIDRSFIKDLTIRPDAVFFVRAIVELCGNLGLAVTAEGIETLDQLAILLDEGCGLLQGYLLGRPGPAAAASELIGRGRLIPARETLPPPPAHTTRRTGEVRRIAAE